MFTNPSKLPSKSASSNINLLRWQCSAMKEEHILSPDDGFLVNLYVILFVNVLGIILALQINPLVIYGAYRNKQLNKISRILTILLAIAGLFGALVIQCSFVASKISVLANIQNPEQSDYCNFILVVTYGTKVVGGLSLITMSGITAERLAAVVYPFHYRTTRTLFVKTLPYALAAFFIHFTTQWYMVVVRKFCKNCNRYIHHHSLCVYHLCLR